MKISFQGIKNPGAYTHKQENVQSVRMGNQDYILPRGRVTTFHCELTNENGNDLDEFKHILKAYPNKHNKNSITIGYEWCINPNNGNKMRVYSVNDNLLDINRVTFDVFNKVFKLLKKVSEMHEEQLVTDKDYLRTVEPQYAFMEYTAYNSSPDILEIVKKAHRPEMAKAGAQALCKKYADILTAYVLS